MVGDKGKVKLVAARQDWWQQGNTGGSKVRLVAAR